MNPVVNGEFADNLGYAAPIYARTLVAAREGGVYSFDVVLLELVTRENPTYVANLGPGNLVEWVSQLSSASKLEDAIDGFLVGKGFNSEIF
ncbi:probably inactive leucine-rich repeat receptor-like protein kinase at5g48380 [Phtheirospermum japonicum]|uniref:Probably inactive leucine-rich repeat receptor-like protein kinase at5g48380 n=1 Tax=Phtheirospermum japonicum TaxID=374723 RepID=A0A830CUM1_9LAMI|nr:probably inactive leucine-rich repeat receptor-like protein kinase at5g48380 [Phtheirospermum japonicum]